MVTMRSVVAVAASKQWYIYQMDVHNAFFNGGLDEEVYMVLLEGFYRQEESQKVCKLQKFLYGLKQASRQWNLKLTEALVHMGFQQSHYDYSLFVRRVGDDIVIILVYVNDLLITGSNHKLLCDTRLDLQSRFKMKDLGELKFFLGIEFARSNKGILMSKRKYSSELISETSLSGAKPISTPMELNQKLTTVEYDLSFRKGNATADEVLRDPGVYQRLVGKLLYLTMTRLDISFVVQVLSQFMHCPRISHMEAASRVVRYIKQAPGLGLLMPAEDTKNLTAYCDSNWGAFVETRRSVTGYLVKFGNA
uniref:Uncharacterized mitochondrial protein AtMg00810-like n=1 Tax=Nicotiana tabacum TaxID=4097 RepID=A0A1S4DBU4_TOBAC|nr:PREDICTED: uncharacterized mitochondrial protein AtMg00810-like [Nicotiana tabacum]